ncbi:MAG: UDP-N-acetylmuramate:L-alanyl-gamma-D-glutamyl-meso-diaminopimelate ligase, partial [Candidatus Latescibacteria bacterium]|nr:UDP-N-acetylmuramate:L-alanyl-gamma-D-glutamyl-meso-diaminopimelate ligase [Candidatus Latescibacterota bacterium]
MTTPSPLHIHLIAICGTGMGALAVMLKAQGHHVTGSDKDVYPPMSTVLSEQNIPVYKGFSVAHLAPQPDLVVIGNAVSRGNPEAEAVLSRKIRYASMPETLKTFFLWNKTSIVVTGTHGKTTTTSMLAWVMEQAGFDPSYIIGGIPIGWATGAKLGAGDVFILEGDEYDSAFFDKRAKFLHYLPDIVIINNIEFDHADIYNNLDEIILAFRRLVNIIPGNGLLIGAADDEHIQALMQGAPCTNQTFGEGINARWAARQVNITPEGTTFNLYEEGSYRDQLTIPMYGAHNVQNALAVVAAAEQVGVPWEKTVTGLGSFPGVKRRLELRGVINGIHVYDDFAHHPTAVETTLCGLRSAYPDKRIWAIFEPRT